MRRALEEKPGDNSYIVTLPGRGYQFVSPVKVIAPEDLTIVPDAAAVGDDHCTAGMVVQRETIRTRITTQERELSALPFPRRVGTKAGLGILLLLTVAGIGYDVYLRSAHHLTEQDTLVLADFTNSTGDPVFDDTLRQGLSSQLEQSPFLNLLSDQRVAQTLALMTQPRDARLSPQLALEVCRRTASTAVLDETIAKVGQRYLLTLKVTSCSNGESLASAEAQAEDKDHVLDALGKTASGIRSKLGESLASVQKYDAPPEDVTTSSLEALQAYGLGYRTMIAKNDRPAAVPLFQRAITLDPNFAMAYARLGITFFNLDEPSRAEENLGKAYDLRGRLSEREKLYVAASYEAMARGNMEEARKSYELWQQIYPRDQFAVGNLGVVYGYLGDYEKSLAAIQEAWQLNPGNALVFSNIVSTYLQLGRVDDALTFALKAKDLHLDGMALHSNLYTAYFLRHDVAGMEREAAELIGKPGWDDLMLHDESDTAAYDGHFSEARTLTQQAVDSARRADKSETAAAYQAESAVREALVGNLTLARQQSGAALALSHSKEVEAFAAIALGLAGDSSQAARLANELNQGFPEDTSVQANFLPSIRAASELQTGHAAQAEQALAADQSYELGETTPEITFCLYPVYLRAEVFLAEKRGTAAALEFQKILDHPGLAGNEIISALAHLGLGRGYARAGDKSKARSAYQGFLTLWKDADPDVPILKQAKEEYAKLQ